MGGWAEHLYVRPDAFVYKVPDSLDADLAVMTELMAVTYNLDKAKEFYSMDGEGFGPALRSPCRASVPWACCMCSRRGSWARATSSHSTVRTIRLGMAQVRRRPHHQHHRPHGR